MVAADSATQAPVATLPVHNGTGEQFEVELANKTVNHRLYQAVLAVTPGLFKQADQDGLSHCGTVPWGFSSFRGHRPRLG